MNNAPSSGRQQLHFSRTSGLESSNHSGGALHGPAVSNAGAEAEPLLTLQRTVGNRAVLAWLASSAKQEQQRNMQASGRPRPNPGARPLPLVLVSGKQAAVQRRVEEYADRTGNSDMPQKADDLDDDVDAAKKIVDSDPALSSVKKSPGGYLQSWADCFDEFVTSGNIPNFFYARYGYAIETLATDFFRGRDHNPYKVSSQVTQGSTRPDFVVSRGPADIAWLDITSEGSVGHILAKQGGGWKSRPYVAEILYDMPQPSDFAISAKGNLTPDQQRKLKSSNAARALREQEFDTGMKAMAVLLGNAYNDKRDAKGDALSRADLKEVTVSVCRDNLGPEIMPALAAGILGSLESVEVGNDKDSGLNLANWAFKDTKTRKWAEGRERLREYGASLMRGHSGPSPGADDEAMDTD